MKYPDERIKGTLKKKKSCGKGMEKRKGKWEKRKMREKT